MLEAHVAICYTYIDSTKLASMLSLWCNKSNKKWISSWPERKIQRNNML